MPMEFINQNILLIALVVVSGVALLMPLIMRPSGNSVSPGEATQLINREDAHILDVREVDEYAAGHLPDAVNIPGGKLAERIGDDDEAALAGHLHERCVIILSADAGAEDAGLLAEILGGRKLGRKPGE